MLPLWAMEEAALPSECRRWPELPLSHVAALPRPFLPLLSQQQQQQQPRPPRLPPCAKRQEKREEGEERREVKRQ